MSDLIRACDGCELMDPGRSHWWDDEPHSLGDDAFQTGARVETLPVHNGPMPGVRRMRPAADRLTVAGTCTDLQKAFLEPMRGTDERQTHGARKR